MAPPSATLGDRSFGIFYSSVYSGHVRCILDAQPRATGLETRCARFLARDSTSEVVATDAPFSPLLLVGQNKVSHDYGSHKLFVNKVVATDVPFSPLLFVGQNKASHNYKSHNFFL